MRTLQHTSSSGAASQQPAMRACCNSQVEQRPNNANVAAASTADDTAMRVLQRLFTKWRNVQTARTSQQTAVRDVSATDALWMLQQLAVSTFEQQQQQQQQWEIQRLRTADVAFKQ
jgi:hypothetical protein